MLNPYHRISLTPSTRPGTNSTSFTATFRIPDQHGIFNFRVNYKRPFLTYIDEKDTVTVRHFAHDEWPRSWAISGAWVPLVGVWGTLTAWVMFVGVWLYSEPTKQRKGEKKAQ
jgi:oligosaccharyltransferase complex subunit beta